MSAIPIFPDFARLSFAHKEILRETAMRFPPYSDFNFVSMCTWDTDETIAVAKLHDNLVVRFSGYEEDDKPFLSLLGTHKLEDTLEGLFAYCQTRGMDEELKLVPHSVIEALPEHLLDRYTITEDRDNHDYIISVEGMMHRRVARNKRRAYNHFLQEHEGHITSEVLDLTSPDVVSAINEVVDGWRQTRRQTAANNNEFKAIERCLRHAQDLELKCYGIAVDGSLVAFIVYEFVSNATAMMHYGKYLRGMPDAFIYVKVELAKQLHQTGIQFMNLEQDLGHEGLRSDKMALRPVEFLRKFTIRRRA